MDSAAAGASSKVSSVSASSSSTLKHKLVLLGDQSVGKTSILTRFMYDTVDQQYQPTIGIDFFSKTIHLEDGRDVRLHLWDTAGQERFHSLIPSYLRNSSATVVVYDITSRSTFFNAFKWIDEVRSESGEEVVIMLVGNKIDQASERREVSAEEAMKKASECNALFMEVSAKHGTHIKQMFRQVAAALPLPAATGGGTDVNSVKSSSAGNTGSAGTIGGGVAAPGISAGQFGSLVRSPFLLTPSAMQAASSSTTGSGGTGSAEDDAHRSRGGTCCGRGM